MLPALLFQFFQLANWIDFDRRKIFIAQTAVSAAIWN